MIYGIAYILVRPFLWLFYRPIIKNRQALRLKGKVIYVANHLTKGDPVGIGMITPRIVHFMAKSELSANKFVAWVLRGLCSFPVEQHTADRKSLKEAIALLEKGKAFGVFPEGHRSVDNYSTDEFDRGYAFIALRADSPVVPVYVLPGSIKFGNRYVCAVGDPIIPSEVKRECPAMKPIDALNERVMNTMLTLRMQAEELI